MTVQTTIDVAAGIVIHKVTGDLLLEDVQQAFAMRAGHPEFRPDMGVLWDLSEANASRMTSNDIRTIAGQNKARLKKKGVRYRVAFLAPRDIEYGLSRMYEMFADASLVENRVFRTPEEARQWLTS